MRTTFDLPDELMRKLKIYAASQGLKMKDVVTACLERQLQYDSPEAQSTRSPLPKFKKASSTGKIIPLRTNAEMEALVENEVDD